MNYLQKKNSRIALIQGCLVPSFMALCLVVSLSVSPKHAYADTCPGGGEHVYSVVIVEFATETTDGLRQFTCINCGYTFDQVIPATGHEWGPWIVDVQPSCETPGHEYRICERYPDNPHSEEREIPALSPTGEHSYVLVSETAPSCTETGLRQYVCKVCGASKEEVLEILGHNWGEWKVVVPPTESKEGLSRRECLNDPGHREEKPIPILEGKKEKAKKPEAPLLVSSKQEELDSFFAPPNAFDAVVLGFDGLFLIIFLVLAIPLVRQLTWVKKKRQEAQLASLERIKTGEKIYDNKLV